MPRTPLAVGVGFLLIAVLTVGVTASAPPAVPGENHRIASGDAPARVVDVPNTTNYLFPSADRPQRQDYVRGSVDVGSAVGASAQRLDGDLRTRTFEIRFDRASSQSGDRLAVVRAGVVDAERRLDRLDAAHERLIRGYNNGSLSREAFVRQVVRLEVRTAQTRAFIERVRTTADSDPATTVPSSLNTRLAELQTRAVLLPTPVGERLTASVTGSAGPVVVYAEGADDGLVLATVDGRTFHRQATVLGDHRPGEPDQFAQDGDLPITLAAQRAAELYPWAYSGNQQFNRQVARQGPGVYRITAEHPQGPDDRDDHLEAYISGSTTDVFHELQALDPEAVPVYRIASNRTAALNLTVTTTTETGPMRVDVTDGQGNPRNATVFVGDRRVGTTGADGRLRTVRPSGTFQVSAVRDGERVTIGSVQFLRTSDS